MRLLVLSGLSVLALSSAAFAAGASTPFDWSGFYAGFAVGAGSFSGLVENNSGYAVDDPPYSIETDGHGLLAGGQIGYNFQTENIVFGVQADAEWTNFDEAFGYDEYSPGYFDNFTAAAITGIASLKGKIGMTAGPGLFYLTGGVVAVMANQCATDDDTLSSDPDSHNCDDATYDAVKSSDTQFGGVIGVGVELQVADKLSIFAEYNHFETKPINQDYFESTGNADFSTKGDLVRAGLNKHF